jgi:DNA-binding NtrC family response regulator
LVLSDLIMPEMGGLELYRHIHSEKPAICMLIVTGYPLEDESQLFAKQGVIEWLQKPFTVKQLTAAVRKVLDRAKRASEEQDDERNASE